MIRDDIAKAEEEVFISLVESLTEDDNDVGPEEEDKVNQDLYKIGLLGNNDTLEEVIFKVNEVIEYLNKNLGV